MLKKLFCATVVALVATLMVLPVQAGEVLSGGQIVAVTSPCSDCGQAVNTTTVLPQGETEEFQPLKDHTWGGDPDDPDNLGWLDIYMCINGYWDESCKHLLYHTIWCD